MITASEPRRAWLGLGGNIGDPIASMAHALQKLDARADTRVLAVSRLYRTPPWGKTDQDWFFNASAVIETGLDPVALLDACLETERSLKRVRNERWGPRTIDIDVLHMPGIALADERLTLPHPRMTGRGFVLVPLADLVAGEAVAGRTVAQWMADADRTGIEIASQDGSWWRQAGAQA